MSKLDEAREYVGTTPVSGAAQFALLVRAGMRPESRLLEYGCGALHLARLAAWYLDPDHYCAVEPNGWLIGAAFDADPEMERMTLDRLASFRGYDNFNARDFDVREFDYIFAHSVLSHAAAWQLPQFFSEARAVLAPGGLIVASLRLGPDTNASEWVYPSVTWFSEETLHREADIAGLRLSVLPEVRRHYSALCPDEVHDWIIAWS